MAFPTALSSTLRATQAIYYGRATTASVPLTRNIFTTAPITGGGALSGDLTLALTTSPANDTVAVGATRTLQGTAPITVNGDNATHNYTSNHTIAVVPFSGTVDGIVTHNSGGVQGKFLKDDNTWGNSPAGGVTSLIAGTAIGLSPSSGLGDVTVSVLQTGPSNPGYVPSIGSADPTQFLCKTNPPTWAVPGASGFVLLQGGFPGTDQAGNVHVTGVIGADTRLIAGGTTSFDSAIIVADGDGTVPGFQHLVASSGGSSGGWYGAFRSRGTLGSPSATQNNDLLGAWYSYGYGSGFFGNVNSGMSVYADGNASTRQPTYLDITAGDIGTGSDLRVTQAGVLVQSSQAITQSSRPLSTLEVQGSIGLASKTVSSSPYSVDSTAIIHRVDSTSASVQMNLPDAASFANRLYTVMKVDDTANWVSLTPSPRLINGLSGIFLNTIGDSATFHSDGTNWWIHDSCISPTVFGARSDGTTVGASSSAENTSLGVAFANNIVPGSVVKLTCRATYNAVSTPNLTIFVRDDSSLIVRVQFPAFSAPTGSNNILEFEFWTICRSVTLGSATMEILKSVLRYGTSAGAATELMALSSSTFTMAAVSNGNIWDINAQFNAPNAGNNFTVKAATLEITTYGGQ